MVFFPPKNHPDGHLPAYVYGRLSYSRVMLYVTKKGRVPTQFRGTSRIPTIPSYCWLGIGTVATKDRNIGYHRGNNVLCGLNATSWNRGLRS